MASYLPLPFFLPRARALGHCQFTSAAAEAIADIRKKSLRENILLPSLLLMRYCLPLYITVNTVSFSDATRSE
jgi:hypothetical protein